MEANLGYLSPMPIADVCTPLPQTVWYAYKSWPNKYNSTNNILNQTKILRGTKCPQNVAWDGLLHDFSTYLPQTLLIIGIRHPIHFFQSFWNMMADHKFSSTRTKTPYDLMEHCSENNPNCQMSCPGKRTMLCLHKTRFHLPLARLGKTLLSHDERELLAPNDKDGGMKLSNYNIQNPIFIYEMNQLQEEDMWDELATLLKVPYIPHDIYKGDKDSRTSSEYRIDLCEAQYDDFRAAILPHAYNMSKWFCEYLVPVAKDDSRNDVIIANPDSFCELVKKYGNDPCNRLIRIDNGTYVLS